LQEKIFIKQLEGFEVKRQEENVYLLRKKLYGLQQAFRAWNNRIDEYFHKLDFVKSLSETTLYVKEHMQI